MHPRNTTALLALLLVGLLTGCASRKYQARPLSPSEMAASLQSRTLSDIRFKEFAEQQLKHPVEPWPPKSWDLPLLTEAGFYFNPEMEIARARAEAARAAIITAGARPNPTITVAPGWESAPESPWLFKFGFGLPIETAGKRGYRIQRSERLARAATFDSANTAWRIRSAIRKALLDYLSAVSDLLLMRTEERVRTEEVDLLQQRLAAGEIPRPEVDLARIGLSNTRLAIHSAEGRAAETKAVLAAAIGVPALALDGTSFSWPELDQPPAADVITPKLIQRQAVVNRLDVRRSLEEYAAAEASLQLEVAKQYPDLQLGPGYNFDEGYNKFSLGLSLTLPLFNRNQGPIAEAEARRKEAAGRFLATQAQVIAASEKALAQYRAALAELAEARRPLAEIQTVRERMMRRAVQIGESDRLALNGVELQSAVAARAQLDALYRAQTALGSLEDAIQRPLQPMDSGPPIP